MAEGSVAVVLRVRPPNPRERAAPSVLHVLNQRAVLFTSEEPGGTGTGPGPSPGPGRRRRSLEFEFDHVFGERATQEEVFEHTTLPLLDTLLAGYNCSVFAYGASGVGKTHTMMGTKRTPGIVHLATVELYKRLEAMKDRSWEVLVSYQQVYKERVYDLLKPQGPLNVWEQPGKGVVAQGLSLHQPTTPEQLLALLAKGNKNRAQRSTKANAASSRSHAIFQIQVKHWDLTGGPSRGLRVAKLSFIDLAGSERAWDTPGRGEGMWEGTSINRSLLAFKSVVRALAGAKGGQSHVPFRDSKLTLLLKDSLVGSFRSTVIAAVSPAAPAGPDTYSTLRFASRARHITLPVSTGMAPRGGPWWGALEYDPNIAGRNVPGLVWPLLLDQGWQLWWFHLRDTFGWLDVAAGIWNKSRQAGTQVYLWWKGFRRGEEEKEMDSAREFDPQFYSRVTALCSGNSSNRTATTWSRVFLSLGKGGGEGVGVPPTPWSLEEAEEQPWRWVHAALLCF
uniref:Kinesin-like protein n=1 Tax=Junco hyemalis TaxID=40217 RepID=A0A8C5IQG0_JUNHY